MTITETENGEITLNIESEQDAASSVVIWFDENQVSGEMIGDEIHCASKNGIRSLPITNLVNNVLYSFCLMDKNSSSVSPFDCISYVKRDNDIASVWLFASSKTLTITLVVLSLTLNVAVGIAIGFWLLNYNPFSKRHSRMNRFLVGSESRCSGHSE